MEYKQRHIHQKFKGMAEHFPAIVISGARQTGKTTFLKKVLPNADYVVFDATIDVESARKDPDLFLINHPPPLILDEIQYAPEVASALKRRIDRDRTNGQYYLTGSQQWGILKNLSESLAGRAVFLDLAPFSLPELYETIDDESWIEHYLNDPNHFTDACSAAHHPKTLTEQLYRGWYPEAQELPIQYIPDFYSSYIRTYIERDVRAAADIENYQQFGRFFQLTAALSAQEINQSQLGREVGITPQTASRWLMLMKSTYQWREIPAFSMNTVKRISGRPKGYIEDTGIMCAASAISSPSAINSHPAKGAVFETAVINEIAKVVQPLSVPPRFHHFRTHAGAEVDLVLERDGYFYPIEIKYKSNPSKQDCRGIDLFRQTYPHLNIAPGLIICMALEPFRITKDIVAVPFLV